MITANLYNKVLKWGDVTMQIARRVLKGAVIALPLLAQLAAVIQFLVADGVPTVWPT